MTDLRLTLLKTMNYRLNLLVKISQAKHAGLTHFAEALIELYRREFVNNKTEK